MGQRVGAFKKGGEWNPLANYVLSSEDSYVF